MNLRRGGLRRAKMCGGGHGHVTNESDNMGGKKERKREVAHNVGKELGGCRGNRELILFLNIATAMSGSQRGQNRSRGAGTVKNRGPKG